MITSTAVTLFLSVLPELTELRNRRKSSQTAEAPTGTSVEVLLSLEGLGCVACTSAVQGAIDAASNSKVVTSTVDLKEQKARIMLLSEEQEAKDTIVPDLIS